MTNILSIETEPQDDDACLKIVFEQLGDRWVHRLVVCHENGETTILKSIEGDDQQTWPPSPPLQDASHHELENGAAVLAVGMAGKNHWSASFSIEDRGSIFADLACLPHAADRVANQDNLGSRYELGEEVEVHEREVHEREVHESESDGVVLLVENLKIVLSPGSGADWSSCLNIENKVFSVFPGGAYFDSASSDSASSDSASSDSASSDSASSDSASSIRWAFRARIDH